MLALCAAVSVFVLWRFWRQDEIMTPEARSITDVELVYKCDRNHTFRALGQVGPRPCPICRQPAYPRAKYRCKTHGVFEVTLLIGRDEDNLARVTHLRLPGRDWVPAETTRRCPRCNSVLTRIPDDPLDVPRGRRNRGG